MEVSPSLGGRNCVVLKPAEQTPASIMLLMELIGDLLPAGVVNVVSGYGLEAGKPLASSKRIKKIAFTGNYYWTFNYAVCITKLNTNYFGIRW